MTRSNVKGFRGGSVEVDGDTFEIHFGKPGHPRIYRRTETSMRRVADDDPILAEVARAYRRQVEEKKAQRVQAASHRLTWRYRVGRWIGRMIARVRAFFYRGLRAILDPFGEP